MDPLPERTMATNEAACHSLGVFDELRRDQRERWRAGQRVLVESYLAKNSSLKNHSDGVLDLIYNEVLLREEANEAPNVEEYRERFPDYATELEYLYQVHRAMLDNTKQEYPPRIGQSISHYRIQRHLGSGGMGEVYLARDVALERSTAIKLLPRGFSPSLRSRLLAEAEASARLQHPGIATFYESGVANGEAFIAMEYVDGETLRQRLRQGPLPWQDAASMTVCLLEALAHAHAAGILHRDIKPDNIILTRDGVAKLLDFGLAKHVVYSSGSDSDTPTHLTGPGQLAGTAGYMSPEQLRGELLDARSDLFAVGATFYEAIVGRPAFHGRTPAERLVAVLSEHAPVVEDADIPSGLRVILAKSLRRDPCERYASAAEFLTELHDVGSVHHFVLPNTVAVVDFRNLATDGETDWIGTGITESLTVKLTKVAAPNVVSREKVLTARVAEKDDVSAHQNIGLMLGCRWVVTGSFEKTDRLLHVSLQLVEVATGRVTASEALQRPVEEIFSLQDEIAVLVAGWLNESAVEERDGSSAAAPSLDAYKCYARGRRLWHRLEKGSFQQAGRYYERAIQLQPAHASALAGLAAVNCLQFTFSTDPRELELASRYAEQAIEADPKLADALVWLGYIRWRQERMEDAIDDLRQAMTLDPTNHLAAYFAGCVSLSNQQLPQALEQLQLAAKLNRKYGWAWAALGWTHFESDNQAEAIWCLHEAVALEHRSGKSPTAGIEGVLGELQRRCGRLDEARRHCRLGLEAAERSDHMYRDTLRGICLCSLGRTALDQRDMESASASFQQAIAHLTGRKRALGGGHLLVQAMAGRAESQRDSLGLVQACTLFRERKQHSFHYFISCSDDVTARMLRHTANALGAPVGDLEPKTN